MSGFDRTGPRGQGPMTGRGLGICGEMGGFTRSRFWGLGGFGRGWRNRYLATGIPGRALGRAGGAYYSDLSAKERVELLQNEADYFEKELKDIRSEIDRLNRNTEEKKG